MLYQYTATIPSEMRDFPEWRRGRKVYAVWVLRCDGNKAIEEKLRAARKHLKGYLMEHYQRQPHITLLVCGFLVKNHKYNDDFTRAQFEAQLRALRKADIQPFEVEIGGMNSFASAPFLEVHDTEGGISRLREVLSQGAYEFRTVPYRPHLTLGLYSDAFPSKRLLAHMADFSSEPVRWTAEQVTFTTYRAEESAGKLCHEYEFYFESRIDEMTGALLL